MAYTIKHETELDSAEKMKAFIDELDPISGSAVLYGAAANYTGDRAQLCTLFGEDALETSVPWVLDAYGYLDMNDYAQQDTADTTAVELASTADISSADYIFPSDRQYITESDMAGWDQKTALLARNEIFARHGYVFQTQEIQNYFAAKSWYTPNSSYDGSDLSDVEKANVDTISAYEQKDGLGRAGCFADKVGARVRSAAMWRAKAITVPVSTMLDHMQRTNIWSAQRLVSMNGRPNIL